MYRNNVPFNIRIPIRIREHTVYLFISQLGYVILDMEKFLMNVVPAYLKEISESIIIEIPIVNWAFIWSPFGLSISLVLVLTKSLIKLFCM